MYVAGCRKRKRALFIMPLMVMLQVCGVQSCQIGSGSECEKAPFVPGHNLAGEGFDVVRMRRTGAYVINVKHHLTDNNTCTLCPNRFRNGQVKTVKTVTLIFHTIILCPFSSIFTCNWPFIYTLRFRSFRQQCLTGVPSAAAASSSPVPSTTLWTPYCAAPTHWSTTTGAWV